MIPKSFIKQAIEMAHEHGVYVSTGDWAEHMLRSGPSAFKDYVEVKIFDIHRKGLVLEKN
ncbi:hypothetical protein NITHO_6670001 [Nitrolancea hollandica Lb]|uniref:Uncharacterized protein n=1 Tax=Nitrolancea hollandica Lb TaxID=1129897 RepID=I4EMW5_9BACT|nr:hypothetical protein NITHO_6670001 [Nitrolancea hollandica Lb]